MLFCAVTVAFLELRYEVLAEKRLVIALTIALPCAVLPGGLRNEAVSPLIVTSERGMSCP